MGEIKKIQNILREGLMDNENALQKKTCSECGKDFKTIVFWGKTKLIPDCACSDRKSEAEEKQREITSVMISANFPKRFICPLEDLTVDTENQNAILQLQKYIVDFNSKNGQGIIFFGQYGTGKTQLAVSLGISLIQKKLAKVCFQAIPLLLEHMRPSENQIRLEDFIAKQVLILDDLGTEKATDWVRERLYILINERYNQMLPTILTTNMKRKDLVENVGEAILSRLAECCEVINLTGPDRRKIVRTGER